jgi:alanine dehydrogenase
VVKVKEPQLHECEHLSAEQVLFCYLHLATAKSQTNELLQRGVTAIAYETVTDADGRLPLLAPMSEVAGRLSVQAGATALQVTNGGRGTLLGGVPGVAPAKVTILGGGVAGINAAQMAIGLHAEVTVIDRSTDRLRALAKEFAGRIKVLMATPDTIANSAFASDLLIGAVLVPGASTPKLIRRDQLADMLPGAVLSGHRHRSRRYVRVQSTHLSRYPDLYRRRYRALLRNKYARSSGAHGHPST